MVEKLEEIINKKREELNELVLDGLGGKPILKKSCELDKLINDYYQLALGENFD